MFTPRTFSLQHALEQDSSEKCQTSREFVSITRIDVIMREDVTEINFQHYHILFK